MSLRRNFELEEEDEAFLQQYERPWETIIDGSPWVLIHDFPVPKGYDHDKVIAAIRIESGYPHAQLDMVYFYPGLQRIDGQPIGRTEARQALDGKTFQRWSRHRTGANPWKPGFDNLGTHIFLVEEWLEREFEKCPAK
ncbi:hypothetical protein EN893_20115 [Mesorhizobium sp. M7A.F.Ca.CA.004.04.2.1]|nr:hypothetical protein EN893_20115 [Mesorhizobium sp. M7A.F.Ca.CA.004.04.2.1]